MNMQNPNIGLSTPPEFLGDGFEPLLLSQQRRQPVLAALSELADLASDGAGRKVRSLRRDLLSITPSVTMIGQIKAGKTSLINAMLGTPDLLPADVNPWTSVVTTLRLHPETRTPPTNATFEFFDEKEWDRLTKFGGRIGELAGRAGSEDEVAKVKLQIEDMRQKSKLRLGRKFELLMGQTHRYGYFDAELIKRYVCLGDDFASDTEQSDQTGRFADITKSAFLTMRAPHIPHMLDIRDTPGINDTFMMREQITLQSIRDSRLCVVVLSAHQALSSDDMALVRLISNAPSREVIIFVNRIDELARPLEEVQQIKQSISETLEKCSTVSDVDIVFGSAIWALVAIQNDVKNLSEASKSALLNWAKSDENRPTTGQDPRHMLFTLSGLPRLHKMLAERMVEGPIKEAHSHITKQAKNIASGIRTQENLMSSSNIGGRRLRGNSGEFQTQLQAIEQSGLQQFEADLAKVLADFQSRLDRVVEGFVARATEALIDHLDQYGDKVVWQYDPTGLRVLLSSAFRAFERDYLSIFRANTEQCVEAITHLAQSALDLPDGALRIEQPYPARIPPPIVIGQTIALDLSSNWWRSWWQRRQGHQSFAQNFKKLVQQEINPVLSMLQESTQTQVCDVGAAILKEFFADQSEIWRGVAEKLELSEGEVAALLKTKDREKRENALCNIERNLDIGG